MTENLARDYAAQLSTELDELQQKSIIEPDAVREQLDEDVLELINEPGEPFQAVLTLGGPDARVVWTARGGANNARLEVTWGGKTESITGDGIRFVASYFDDQREDGAW